MTIVISRGCGDCGNNACAFSRGYVGYRDRCACWKGIMVNSSFVLIRQLLCCYPLHVWVQAVKAVQQHLQLMLSDRVCWKLKADRELFTAWEFPPALVCPMPLFLRALLSLAL